VTSEHPLRIGVIGDRVLGDVNACLAGVDKILARIAGAFPDRTFTVVTALAEGADRLVPARVLIRPGARVHAVLPLPPLDYEADFETVASLSAFRALLALDPHPAAIPPAPTRAAAYAAGGRYVVEHCDVLVAVWDGRGGAGEGATGEIVALARDRGLPVAWVHSGPVKHARVEGETRASAGRDADPGRVSYEGIWPA
jgi:hypothetical protein